MAYLAAHLLNWLHNKQPNRSQGHTESFRDPLGASSYRKDTPKNRRNEVSSERITFCNNNILQIWLPHLPALVVSHREERSISLLECMRNLAKTSHTESTGLDFAASLACYEERQATQSSFISSLVCSLPCWMENIHQTTKRCC